MYSIPVYCVLHGLSIVPADDASCPLCDTADEATFNQYDLENHHSAQHGVQPTYDLTASSAAPLERATGAVLEPQAEGRGA